MRGPHWTVLAVVGLAGCAADTGTGGAASRDAQVQACAEAVAGHVGLPPDAVAATWRAATAQQTAWVEVRDGDRLHTCEVDGAARVLQIQHPGA